MANSIYQLTRCNWEIILRSDTIVQEVASNVEICLGPQKILKIPQIYMQEKYAIVDFILVCIEIEDIRKKKKKKRTRNDAKKLLFSGQ
jgi:2-keto-4-pentenoate hydratase